MQKVKYGDSYIFIDDSKVDEKETGVVIKENSDLEKTQEIKLDLENTSLEDTITDLWGNQDEQ